MVDTTSPPNSYDIPPNCHVDITANLEVIYLAVQQFDVRFILRALRAISSFRKRLGKGDAGRDLIKSVRESRIAAGAEQGKSVTTVKKGKSEQGGLLPEEEIYLAILEQVSNIRTNHDFVVSGTLSVGYDVGDIMLMPLLTDNTSRFRRV